MIVFSKKCPYLIEVHTDVYLQVNCNMMSWICLKIIPEGVGGYTEINQHCQ